VPNVSVIIPVYNSMAYLPQALESVIQQTYQDFEVLIIDDGSTDQIKSWSQTLSDPRIHFFSQSNQGISAARNTGLQEAKGRYISFLDADDIWQPKKLIKQLEQLESDPDIGLSYTWAVSIDPKGQILGRIFNGSLKRQAWSQLVVRNAIPSASVAVVRRSCLEKIGGFDTDLSHVNDRDMWLRIAKDYEVACVPEVLVLKRQHAHNVSRNWRAIEQASKQVLEKAFSSPPPDLKEDELHSLQKASYAQLNFLLAWKPLQCKSPDPSKAMAFYCKALQQNPLLIFSREGIRCGVAIAIMSVLGPKSYANTRNVLIKLRQQHIKSPVALVK
jgi:glycosyltransferase involved in cell wall biosynthesis